MSEKKNKTNKNQDDVNDNAKQSDEQENEKSDRDKEKEIEALLKQLKDLEKQKQASSNKKKRPRGMIMVEFGSRFHPNGLLNFAMYFMVNLLVIYGVSELFGFAQFSGDLIDIIAFVGVYTLIEILFRQYVVYNHFRFVMRSFGFIFFFGYLTIFYLLENYIFVDVFNFRHETMFVIFISLFIVFRYLLSHIIRNIILKAMRW